MINSFNNQINGKQSLGTVRNRTNKFFELRKKVNEENSYNTGSSLNDTGKTSLLGKKVDKSLKLTELTNFNGNTKYVDIFNSTNVLYEELRQSYVILQQEQQRRIIPKFDDDENKRIDKKIKELVIEMTRKVKQADENINLLNRLKFNSASEEEVKENMKLNLVTKIKEFSRDFQINEEKYMKKYQELVGDTTRYDFEDLDGSHKSSSSTNLKTNDFLATDHSNKILRQRDEDINTLLNSITELAGVFKDLQSLVHHQGTILDRIDYNIDTTSQNIQNANKNLKETEKMMKNSCYRNSMLCIITAIFIMGILLVFKFFK